MTEVVGPGRIWHSWVCILAFSFTAAVGMLCNYTGNFAKAEVKHVAITIEAKTHKLQLDDRRSQVSSKTSFEPRYMAMVCPSVDISNREDRQQTKARIGNGIASYLTMVAVARAVGRSLVVIQQPTLSNASLNDSAFIELLQNHWRSIPGTVNISTISPTSWELWTDRKFALAPGCPSGLLSSTALPPWLPEPWPQHPTSCRTKLRLELLKDELASPNAPRLIVADFAVRNLWLYPGTQPSWMHPWIPGAYRSKREPPSIIDIECALLPKLKYVASAKAYITSELGTRVLALHIRLGDALWAKLNHVTPAVVLASVLNDFCHKHKVHTIFVAALPKPLEYLQLLKEHTHVPIRLIDMAALCRFVPCIEKQVAPMMMDRLIASHADVAFASFPGASTFGDQIARLRFCFNKSTALDQELETMWTRKHREYLLLDAKIQPALEGLAQRFGCSKTDVGHIQVAQRAFIGTEWTKWILDLANSTKKSSRSGKWVITRRMLASKCNVEAKPTRTWHGINIGCGTFDVQPCVRRMAEALIRTTSTLRTSRDFKNETKS